MKIAMTGATGNLGRLVARQLLYRIREEELLLVARRPGAVRAGLEGRAYPEVRYGDYDVPESLGPAFRGADKLLLISSPHSDEDVRLRQHRAAVEAARREGVGHLVYTSVAFAEKGRLPQHRLHLETERAILESGIPYTFLRNAYYMDIVRFLGVREAAASGILPSPPGDWTFNAASREDLALAAAVVLSEEGHEGRVYELTASRSWNLDELARALTEATGRRVVHQTDPDYANPIYKLLPLSEMKKVSPDLERLIGRPACGVDDEVRRIFSE